MDDDDDDDEPFPYKTPEQKLKKNEASKRYREKNWDAIKAKKQQIFTCECGCTLQRRHEDRHRHTQNHYSLLRLQNL